MQIKIFILFILSFIFFNCTKNIVSSHSPQKGFDEKKNEEMLLGKIFLDDLQFVPYKNWYEETYQKYISNEVDLSEIQKIILDDITIEIAMGTWCSDTRKEIPAFVKILHQLNFSLEKVNFFCVDRTKQIPLGFPQEKNIESVPTIIFYKHGNELGRIVESPNETLEKDFLKILQTHE